MRREIWILLIFISGFLFYYYQINPSCEKAEKFSVAAIRTFFFILLYVILCIYSFHIEKIKGNYSKLKKLADRIITTLAPIVLPLILFHAYADNCGFNATIISNILLLLILLLTIDLKSNIRKSIIQFYETKINKFGSDLFFRYPPREMSDIYTQLIIVAIIVFLIALIN